MAVLNADGKGKNFPDEFITRRIKALRGPINLTTYLSLTCTNCPDVVQTLNVMVVLNHQIRHEAVDGAINEDEVNRMKVQAVPTVFADGEQIHVGRGSIGDLLEKLEARYGSVELEAAETKNMMFWWPVVVLPEQQLPSIGPKRIESSGDSRTYRWTGK